MRALLNSTRARLALLGVIVLVILVGAGLVFFGPRLLAAPAQPVAFNHQAMVGMGISCIHCHNSALESPAAGMPSVQKCMGCHKVVDPDNAEIKKVAAYWDQQQPIPWVRVNQLPRFVFFSHQVHLAGGVNCERCHGDVAHMTVAQPVVTMNMGWCLDCHEKQPEPRAEQLKECDTCHR